MLAVTFHTVCEINDYRQLSYLRRLEVYRAEGQPSFSAHRTALIVTDGENKYQQYDSHNVKQACDVEFFQQGQSHALEIVVVHLHEEYQRKHKDLWGQLNEAKRNNKTQRCNEIMTEMMERIYNE